MTVPKWYVIAKNEYRIHTSAIRRWRVMIPLIALITLPILAGYFTSQIIQVVMDDFLSFILSVVAVGVIKIILLVMFLMFIVFPIGQMLRSDQTEQLEIFLSAPVKPSDILLGKFLGGMPLYSIGVAVIASVFAALLAPLGLGLIQYAIVIMIFVLILFSGLWIGVVIASVLKTKLSATANGKDIGKAIGMLVALPMVALMYALMGGSVTEALADPNTNTTVSAILSVFPSSWSGDLIMEFAKHPGDLPSMWFFTLTRFGGLLLFFVISLYIGTKVAERTYRLKVVSFHSSIAKPDGMFYKAVRTIGGGASSGALLVAMFKDYIRRLQNISNLTYMIGVLILINIFLGDMDDPFFVALISTVVLAIMAGMIVGEVTVRGKENLFIYRKSPRGEERLVSARLIQSWLVAVPLAAIYIIVLVTLLRFPWDMALILVLYIIVVMAAFVVAALGLYLWKPVFSDKPADMMGNVMILNLVAILPMIGLVEGLGNEWSALALMMPVSWIMAAVFLSVGLKNLKMIE